MFHCVSSPVYGVKTLSQTLCWPLGLIGCPSTLSQVLQALRTCCPQILYLLLANTGHSHTVCTLSSLSCPHSGQSCRSLCPFLYRWALRVVWPVNSPTAALSLNLLTARSSLSLLVRGYLIRILDSQQPVQAAHLSWCLISKCVLTCVFPPPPPPTLKDITVNWLGGTTISPFLA
jgi:hypothetical protein